jgi:hypothetical protein
MPAQVIPMVRTEIGKEPEHDWRKPFLSFVGDQMEAMVKGDSMATLDDITSALSANRSEILGQLILTLLKKRFGAFFVQEHCDCPRCGKVLKRRGLHKREIVTLSGSFELERPYFYCVTCSYGFYPLDEILKLSQSSFHYDVQQLGAWFASELPFDLTSEAMKRSTGISFSGASLHDCVKRISSDLKVTDVCPDRAEILQKIEDFSEGNRCRPVVMATMDGAYAPVRPEPSPYKGKRGAGDWDDVKGLRLYLVDKDRIEQLISWHQIGTSQDLGAALRAIKEAGLVPEDRVRLCVVADGAAWIWKCAQEVFPNAKQVLDYFHCSQHLHELGSAQYGKGTLKAKEWAEVSLLRLFLKQASHVIAGIKRMKPASPEAAKLIRQTANYLKNHARRMDYGTLRRGGYHIGSGAIESANKLISHVRLKRPGAWWYPSNANNILKLRCAKYNGTFDKVMQRHRDKDLERRQAQRTRLRTNPLQGPA